MADGEGAGGRPRLWPDPVPFVAKVEEYFEHAKAESEPPNMSDLSLFLGFDDRESFSHYETYGGEFSRTVKRARLRIEADRHRRLVCKDTFNAGLIFDLKNNHGWKDKTEQEHSGGMTIGWQTGKPPGT